MLEATFRLLVAKRGRGFDSLLLWYRSRFGDRGDDSLVLCNDMTSAEKGEEY